MDRLLRHLRHHLAAPFTGERRVAAHGRPFDPRHLVTRPRTANEAAIRARAQTSYLGDDTVLARVLGRYKMYLDARDVGMSGNLMADGFWEMWLSEAMARVLRPGMVMADVGANLGYFTLLAGDLVGPGGAIHAFEPNPALARRLRASVSINPAGRCVTLYELALSDDDRGAALVVPADEPKNGTIVGRDSRPDALPVATQRMEAIAALADVDVVKIDVEGAEAAVWRGMAGILARRRPMTIFLEFAAARYADPAALLREIAVHGFSLSVIEHSARRVALTPEALLARPHDSDQMLLLER